MDTTELCRFVTEGLGAVAVPADAASMQAYMKTTMPFFGVKKPLRVPINREVKERFAPNDRVEYEAAVRALWALPHREEKYTALFYARQFKRLITSESLGLYEQLIREGQWWDFVDEVAGGIISQVYLHERSTLRPIMKAWIDDGDMWIRRSALLSHLKHRTDTDEVQLFDFCRRRMHEKEFFIKKAIGWVLREYAKPRPEAVRAFLLAEKDNLSGLSFREAARPLVQAGLL